MATPTHIIAEAGVNHNGVPDLAFALASAAHSAGADSVKFQTFDSSEIVTSAAGKADYQKQHSDAKESQQAMLARLQLSHGLHRELIQHCDGLGINFLSSAFDLGSLRFLINDLKLSTIKFGSGELLNAPLLYEAARSGVRIIISTGMANMADIEQSLGVLALGMSDVPPERPTRMAFEEAWSDRSLRERVQERVTVLHCTSSYPTPAEYVNLLAMRTIASAFGVPVGYSDHTESGSICVAAVALGARVLEKHLTLDRTMQGPDHAASMEPGPFNAMVDGVRDVERALGSAIKTPSEIERPIAAVARKSLVARRAIKAGEPFSADNLTIKRPGTGICPLSYFESLGTTAKRDYAPDDLID